jgi:hypothetical protein
MKSEWSEAQVSVTSGSDVEDVHEVEQSLRAAVLAAGERWSSGLRDLVPLVTALDTSGEWAADDFVSCAHWIAASLDVELSTAREWLRVGRALLTLDVIAAAFADNRLSYSKVRALTRVATLATQVELCDLAERVTAARLAHAVAAWLMRHETPEQTEARQHQARSFTSHVDVFGMVVGSFRLPPEVGAGITKPVDALVLRRRPGRRIRNASADASADDHDRWPTVAQQRADAFVDIVNGGGSTVTAEVIMHVRGDGCSLDDGTPISESVVERIAPTAFLRALIHDAEGRPINASGKQRHPTERQRRVVKARDRVCVDCGATEFLEYDHEPDFEVTKHTTVDESKLRCRTCHRARHAREETTEA